LLLLPASNNTTWLSVEDCTRLTHVITEAQSCVLGTKKKKNQSYIFLRRVSTSGAMENNENNANQATTEQSVVQEKAAAVESNAEKTQGESNTNAEKMEVEQKESEDKSEAEEEEEKGTPKKRGRKKKSDTTAKAKPELPRSNSIQTRSKSLKRTHDKVEADPALKAAHDALEPLAKKARTTRAAAKPKNNNVEASENLSEEETEQLTMIYNLCDIDK